MVSPESDTASEAVPPPEVEPPAEPAAPAAEPLPDPVAVPDVVAEAETPADDTASEAVPPPEVEPPAEPRAEFKKVQGQSDESASDILEIGDVCKELDTLDVTVDLKRDCIPTVMDIPWDQGMKFDWNLDFNWKF